MHTVSLEEVTKGVSNERWFEKIVIYSISRQDRGKRSLGVDGD